MKRAYLFLALAAACCDRSGAQTSTGALGVYQVQPNFYMITGAGGNIGVQIGPDGVVMVDTGSKGASDQVLAEIRKLSNQPIRFLFNTSADDDQAGGNEAISKAGVYFAANNFAGAGSASAPIMATENVLNRMSASRPGVWPVTAQPTDTFVESEKDVYLNREGIAMMAEPAAHTDGDALVFFRRSDVIMAGDIIDTNHFPVIDLAHGGSIQGEVEALNRIVKLAITGIPLVWEGGGTQVVPGHGYICDQADVVEYRDMITVIRDVVQDMISRGMTLDQVKEANPTKGYRGRYGSDTGPWTTDMFVEAVYKSLKK